MRVLQDVMLGRKPREDGEGRMDFMRACKPLQRTLFYFEGDMEMLEAMGNMTQPRFNGVPVASVLRKIIDTMGEVEDQLGGIWNNASKRQW